MADNFQVPGGTGPYIATRDVGGVHYPVGVNGLYNPVTGLVVRDEPSYGEILRPSASYTGAPYSHTKNAVRHRGARVSCWVTGVPGGGGTSNNGTLSVSVFGMSSSGSWTSLGYALSINSPAEYSTVIYPGASDVPSGNILMRNLPPAVTYGVYVIGSVQASTGWVYTLSLELLA